MSSTTVCMADTSIVPFPSMDSTCTQSSNTASRPLPHIPCRNARSHPLMSNLDMSSSGSSISTDSANYALQTCSPTYVRYNSGSSSSSSTPSDETRPTIIPHSKRVISQHSIGSRDFITPVAPVSTPVKPTNGRSFIDIESQKQTPSRDSSDDELTPRPFPVLKQATLSNVGKLRLQGSTGKHARHASDSSYPPFPVGAVNANQPLQTIRKKSGQPVKSSLKSSRRPDLHVDTGGSFAKSEPVTPTHAKVVHFDSKLEHVKLFLAEQKPLAVSRDGSPTSDTSGDDFPSFIYGDGEKRRVKMLVPNMPSPPGRNENVALQGLVLSQEQRTITGTVRVRNIAYEKWVAVRFTLDWWQTTSEVTARHERTIENGVFDAFTFCIRLHDIWSRIEEKTIFVALRYAVAGQEYWDNNAGKNYHIKFVVEPTSEPSSAVDSEASLKDLNLRLEDVVKARSAPIPVAPHRLGRSFSADQCSSFVKSPGRHDFTSPYKAQWTKSASPPPNRHTRTHTYPAGVPTTTKLDVAPWSKTDETKPVLTPPRSPLPPTLSVESSRDSLPASPTRSETMAASLDGASPSRSPDGRDRNHRRGYMDIIKEESPTIRRTPTGSPLRFDMTSKGSATELQLPRTRSYPFVGQKVGSTESTLQFTAKPPLSIQTAPVGDGGGSEESTPYEASQSSSETTPPSTSLISPSSGYPRSDTNYKQFLEQFCFYTGTDSPLQGSSESLPRSHSAPSIERYLLSHSPPQSFLSHMYDSPTRFPFDSGKSTNSTVVRVQ